MRFEETEADEMADGRPLRILVVDDEALLLFYLSDLIEDLGHKPLCAASGAEALALLATETAVDLLITDQSMPDMKGSELAALVRTQNPRLPIVLASGYGESVRDEGVEMTYLAKPFNIADLEQVIATVADMPGV